MHALRQITADRPVADSPPRKRGLALLTAGLNIHTLFRYINQKETNR